MTPKAKTTLSESKHEQVGLYQTKHFLPNKMKTTYGMKIFSNHISDKGLTPKCRKNSNNPIAKKKEQPVKKWAENLNRHFPPKNT